MNRLNRATELLVAFISVLLGGIGIATKELPQFMMDGPSGGNAAPLEGNAALAFGSVLVAAGIVLAWQSIRKLMRPGADNPAQTQNDDKRV